MPTGFYPSGRRNRKSRAGGRNIIGNGHTAVWDILRRRSLPAVQPLCFPNAFMSPVLGPSKLKMNSLRSALTALRAGVRVPRRKAKGRIQRFLMASFSIYDWQEKRGQVTTSAAAVNFERRSGAGVRQEH